MSTGGAKFSSDTVAIQVKLPSQHTDKMRETRREYKGWMSGYISRVPVPVGKFTFHAGRRWHLESVKLRPDKTGVIQKQKLMLYTMTF